LELPLGDWFCDDECRKNAGLRVGRSKCKRVEK
jgi:hypothetical protein